MSLTALLLAVAGVVAAIDWWAVAGERRAVELVAKPLTMALLVVVAATAGSVDADVRLLLVIGAALGLIGDIALLGEGDGAFMTGLASFAIGHVAYAGAALLTGFSPTWAVGGAVFTAALLSFRFVTRTLPGARASGGPILGGAVVFYALVISLMVVSSWGTTSTSAAVGASLFAISDWVLGYQRFVAPLPGGRVAVHVPYHVGQALLIVALVTA